MKNKKTKKKKKSARLPLVLMLTTLIFTVAICLSILIIAVGRDMLAIGKDDSLKMITITEGADAKSVAQTLADEKIIKIQKEIKDRERGRKCGFSLSGSMFFCISGRICGFDCRRRRTDLTSGIYDCGTAGTYCNCNK